MIDEATYKVLVDISTYLERIAEALESIDDHTGRKDAADGS